MRPSYLQNHYSLEKTEIGYRFLTTSNVEYYLTFIEYPDVDMTLATKMYVFNIERNSPKARHDVKVRDTILYVLDEFFRTHDDALITVTDISDNRQNARKRLFENWFMKYNNGRLLKIDGMYYIEESPVHVSLLFASDHFNQQNLKLAFNHLVENNFYC